MRKVITVLRAQLHKERGTFTRSQQEMIHLACKDYFDWSNVLEQEEYGMLSQ
jgi:hypothetical protein